MLGLSEHKTPVLQSVTTLNSARHIGHSHLRDPVGHFFCSSAARSVCEMQPAAYTVQPEGGDFSSCTISQFWGLPCSLPLPKFFVPNKNLKKNP